MSGWLIRHAGWIIAGIWVAACIAFAANNVLALSSAPSREEPSNGR